MRSTVEYGQHDVALEAQAQIPAFADELKCLQILIQNATPVDFLQFSMAARWEADMLGVSNLVAQREMEHCAQHLLHLLIADPGVLKEEITQFKAQVSFLGLLKTGVQSDRWGTYCPIWTFCCLVLDLRLLPEHLNFPRWLKACLKAMMLNIGGEMQITFS